MNAPEKRALSLPSASEYILDNFKPTDRVAVLVLNRQVGETTQGSRQPKKPQALNSEHGCGTRTQMEPTFLSE